MLQIRKAQKEDAESLRELYHCHLAPFSPEQELGRWREKLERFEQDPNYHLLVGCAQGRIVSSVTLIIIENLTHDLRPYAIVENVVTHGAYRGRHYASALMEEASKRAKAAGCYKVMLLTGSKKESTLRFYENCGFNRFDKTGFIKKL